MSEIRKGGMRRLPHSLLFSVTLLKSTVLFSVLPPPPPPPPPPGVPRPSRALLWSRFPGADWGDASSPVPGGGGQGEEKGGQWGEKRGGGEGERRSLESKVLTAQEVFINEFIECYHTLLGLSTSCTFTGNRMQEANTPIQLSFPKNSVCVCVFI